MEEIERQIQISRRGRGDRREEANQQHKTAALISRNVLLTKKANTDFHARLNEFIRAGRGRREEAS